MIISESTIWCSSSGPLGLKCCLLNGVEAWMCARRGCIDGVSEGPYVSEGRGPQSSQQDVNIMWASSTLVWAL